MVGVRRTNWLLAVTMIAMVALASAGWAQETQLAGISLNDTPDDLMSNPAYGPPHAMFTPGNGFNFVRATPTPGVPAWARAVQMGSLGGDQVQWIYNRDPWVVGAVLTGVGINARVTDIVVSQWRTFQPSRIAETREGIRLGDTFADVLETYGWPNRMAIMSEAAAAPTAAAGPAVGAPAPAVGAFRLGVRGDDDEDYARPGMPFAPPPLPSVGPPGPGAPAAATYQQPPAARHTATALAGAAGDVTFSQACMLSYPSVDFLLYRMKVFRIHVYGTTGQAAPSAPALAGAGPALPPAMAAPTMPQPGAAAGAGLRLGRRDD